MPAEPVLKRRVVPTHPASPSTGARRHAAARSARAAAVTTAKVSTPTAWCRTACQTGASSRMTSAPRPICTTTRPAASATSRRSARRRRRRGRGCARTGTGGRGRSQAASTRCVKWIRIPPSLRSGTSAPSQSGQVVQASEAPLLAVIAALIIASSASPQASTAGPSSRSAPAGPCHPASDDVDAQGHRQDQERVAQMDGHRPRAVADRAR